MIDFYSLTDEQFITVGTYTANLNKKLNFK